MDCVQNLNGSGVVCRVVFFRGESDLSPHTPAFIGYPWVCGRRQAPGEHSRPDERASSCSIPSWRKEGPKGP